MLGIKYIENIEYLKYTFILSSQTLMKLIKRL